MEKNNNNYFFLLLYQLLKSYQGALSGISQEFCCLIDVMTAIPVQLLIQRSYNYFQYCYEIIINHKTAPVLVDAFLICNGLGGLRAPKQSVPLICLLKQHMDFRREKMCCLALGKQVCLAWKKIPLPSFHCDLDPSTLCMCCSVLASSSLPPRC